MKERLNLTLTEEMLETTQMQALSYAARGNDSSQRKDMALDQQAKIVVPLFAEAPYYQSSMMQDIQTRNTIIRKRRGKITLLAKFRHHFMNFFIFRLNGKIDILRTDKFHTTNNFTSLLDTDLELLEIGKEYDIRSDEENFCLTYPVAYDPVTDTVGTGKNILTAISTNVNNAADSCLVSENFCKKFTCMRKSTIKIELIDKTIVSKYENLFPEIGDLIKDDIVFKIVNETNDPIILGQNPDIPSGFEDEQIRIDANSFLSRIEVYSNVKCNDPILERHRQELLEYRHKIYDVLASYDRSELSEKATIYMENYKHDMFRINSTSVDFPYIKLTFYTIDVPDNLGYKFSIQSGGKFTIERIYRDGEFVDELGRNIDCIYISQSLIARSTASPLYELFQTGVMAKLKYLVERDEITPKKTFEFIKTWHKMLGLEKENAYIGMDEDELYQFIKENFPIICYLPYTNKNDIPSQSKMFLYANKMIDYDYVQTYHIEDNGMKIPQTCKHEVGYLWFNRQKNDPREANSSVSITETNSKGYPIEKNSSKKTGRSSYSKNMQTVDVLTKMSMIIQDCNSVNTRIFCHNVGGSHAIHEQLVSCGINLHLYQDNSKNNEVEEMED